MGERGCTCPCQGTCDWAIQWKSMPWKAKPLHFDFDIQDDKVVTERTEEDGVIFIKHKRVRE